jgi:hypothetical protein
MAPNVLLARRQLDYAFQSETRAIGWRLAREAITTQSETRSPVELDWSLVYPCFAAGGSQASRLIDTN